MSLKLAAKLRGHTGNISCLVFSSNGDLLSSGGDDEQVRIWDVENRQCRQVLHDPAGRWGQITIINWVSHTASGDILYFGTGRGKVLFYQSKDHGTPFRETFSAQVFDQVSVEAIAHDPVNRKLAITSHDGDIQMWRETTNKEWRRVWRTKTSEATILRGVHFLNQYKDIITFRLETGEATCMDVETADTTRTTQMKSCIGHVSLYNDMVLIDNLRDGFDLYNLTRPYPMRSFPIPTTKYFVRQGVFVDFMRLAVCGSDHGKVYVFDVKSATLVETLEHGEANTFIHAIDGFHDRNQGRTLIASGSLGQEKPEICLWINSKQDKLENRQKNDKYDINRRKKDELPRPPELSTFWSAVVNFIIAVVVLKMWDSGKIDDGMKWISDKLMNRDGN